MRGGIFVIDYTRNCHWKRLLKNHPFKIWISKMNSQIYFGSLDLQRFEIDITNFTLRFQKSPVLMQTDLTYGWKTIIV